MSTQAAPAAPAAPNATPPAGGDASASQDNYDFESALDGVIKQAGGDPAKAASQEATLPAAVVQKKNDHAALTVDKTVEKKEETNQDEDGSGNLLGSLLKGDDITDDKLNPPKPGDAPTDPNSRQFKTWAELRGAHDLLLKEKANWDKQRAELEGKIPKDYDNIKGELQKSKDYISKLDLSQRPEFQREVTIPIDTITKDFEGIAERIGVSKALLMEAVNMPDEGKREEALQKILSEHSTTVSQGTVAKLYLKADELHKLYKAEQQYMEHAPKMMEELKKQEAAAKEKEEASAKEEFGRASNVAIQVLGKTIPFLKEADGSIKPETIDQLRAEAGRDFTALKPAQKALALMAPGLLQRSLDVIKTKDAEVATVKQEVASLKLQLAKLAGASPGTDTSATPSNQQQKTPSLDPFENMSSIQLSKLPV